MQTLLQLAVHACSGASCIVSCSLPRAKCRRFRQLNSICGCHGLLKKPISMKLKGTWQSHGRQDELRPTDDLTAVAAQCMSIFITLKIHLECLVRSRANIQALATQFTVIHLRCSRTGAPRSDKDLVEQISDLAVTLWLASRHAAGSPR